MQECLKDRLVQTIGVGRVTSYSPSGSPLSATIADMSAYVEAKRSVVAAAGGTEKITTHLIITEAEIRLDDDIYMPGVSRVASNRRTPAAVDVFYDPFTGAVDHYETRL